MISLDARDVSAILAFATSVANQNATLAAWLVEAHDRIEELEAQQFDPQAKGARCRCGHHQQQHLEDICVIGRCDCSEFRVPYARGAKVLDPLQRQTTELPRRMR